MRFSTVFSSIAVLLVAISGVSASCTSDIDCGRGKMCKFRGVKDSRGECYSRGEGPPTPKVSRHRKRSYDIDELDARELEDLEDEILARYFDDDEFDL